VYFILLQSAGKRRTITWHWAIKDDLSAGSGKRSAESGKLAATQLRYLLDVQEHTETPCLTELRKKCST